MPRTSSSKKAGTQTSPRQRKTVGRVMHEFAHGELKSGPDGKAGQVKNRRQAIAIALSEAGASKFESKTKNRRHFAKTARKEAKGETAQQEAEGKSHVGASGRRESSPAMGGKDASSRSGRRRGSAAARGRHSGAAKPPGGTRRDLYERARAKGVPGRSKMNKQQLEKALSRT
jgi:hypothetical protein